MGNKQYFIFDPILHVMYEPQFLGASPDGIVDDVSIVEVKCPYVGRDNDIKLGKAFPFLKYSADGDIVLNKTNNYYCQVQGQYIFQFSVFIFLAFVFVHYITGYFWF
jgi:hypothetical protein